MSRKLELQGQKFNKLTAIKENGKDKKGQVLWLCKCECGNFTNVRGTELYNGKIRLGLVLGGFAKSLWEVDCIGTFGANKYCDNGWQSVENGIGRYTDALLRHLFAYLEGEEIDPENGYRHLAHAA